MEGGRVGEGYYIQTAGVEVLSCNWEGLLKDLDYHLQNECILKGEKCKYWEVGCTTMVNSGNKRVHENQDISIHLDLAINELSNAKKQRERVE